MPRHSSQQTGFGFCTTVDKPVGGIWISGVHGHLWWRIRPCDEIHIPLVVLPPGLLGGVGSLKEEDIISFALLMLPPRPLHTVDHFACCVTRMRNYDQNLGARRAGPGISQYSEPSEGQSDENQRFGS